MDIGKITSGGAVLGQIDNAVPDPLRWVVNSLGVDSQGEIIYMRGKTGPSWDFEKDPYATVGGEVRLTNMKNIQHNGKKFMVTEIFERNIEGHMIDHDDWFTQSDLAPQKMVVTHKEYNSVWVRTNIKRFVSDKPRLEVVPNGVNVYNSVKHLAVENPQDFWITEENIQRCLKRKLCRSVSEGVARKPKKTARKSLSITYHQNWGSMRMNNCQRTCDTKTEE